MKNNILLALTFLISNLFAQSISGKVKDETTGEDIIGATVMVKGQSKGAATDIDGSYKFDISPGIYDIEVRCISYTSKLIEKVEVKSKEVLELNVLLKAQASELNVTTITAQGNRESSNYIVMEQKASLVVFDGISSDQMKRTPDRNTADVLKRVSGATIQDNSFVIIRGLPDRYNAAFINNSPLPSSEPDRKAFAFDIFPASLLSDLKIIKSAMPSLTGEFAGGIIQVRTKDIPDKNYYSFSLGTSFNLITTFNNFTSNVKGKTDAFGIDDGTRLLPQGIPSNSELIEIQNNVTNENKDKLVGFARQFNNSYALTNSPALPGLSLQYAMGHNINLVPKAKREMTSSKKELGSVLALTYNTMQTYRENERFDYDLIGKVVEYDDKQFNTNTSWGVLWNLAFILSKTNGANNRIGLKNMFNVNSNDQYIYRNGFQYDNGFQVKSHNMLYTQNTMFSSQLSGEHILPKSKIRFDWGAGFSSLNREIPDYRILEYRRDITDTTQPFLVPFSGTVQSNVASRFFSTQKDKIYSGNFDFSYPLKIGATKHELKVGSFLQYKDRNFEGRVFGFTTYSPTGTDISTISALPVDQIFRESSFSNQGLMLSEVTRKSDGYNYFASTVAGYLQIENSFFENKLKFIWGGRLEVFRQNLATFNVADESPINIDSTVFDFLPSMNVVYGFHPKFNLRFSASQTVTRPESRELAPFAFYDFSNFALVGGNANLLRTKITNLDLRFEYYPHAGQSISITGFYKNFQNPIEKVLSEVSLSRFFTYINVPNADVAGAELEFKLSIGSFIKKKHSRVLDDLIFTGNFSYIFSNVFVQDTISNTEVNRPMQGQSPYILNASIQYNDSKYDFGIALSFNYVGERIFSVGNSNFPTIWENPRPVLDLQLTKTFLKKKLELRLNFRDLIAYNAIFYQDNNNDKTYNEGSDQLMVRQRLGQQISFNIGFKF